MVPKFHGKRVSATIFCLSETSWWNWSLVSRLFERKVFSAAINRSENVTEIAADTNRHKIWIVENVTGVKLSKRWFVETQSETSWRHSCYNDSRPLSLVANFPSAGFANLLPSSSIGAIRTAEIAAYIYRMYSLIGCCMKHELTYSSVIRYSVQDESMYTTSASSLPSTSIQEVLFINHWNHIHMIDSRLLIGCASSLPDTM